ncbi:MAG: protein-L-isoaspartate O-methyltransferase [Burkholderiales bacterium]|nr:protein-L-isoaspartate O-methyltransferase [Burkholderiales bacterium]
MNIEKARFNMIEQQIRPWNVLDKDVLDMLIVVKRENYFPESQKSLAFFDTALPLPGGAHAMEPKLEARIVQELNLKKQESVLLVGAANGYLAALLAYKARHVTVLESSAELKDLAAQNLSKNGVANVDVIWADGPAAKHIGCYDAIVVAGALESVPDSLKKQLNVGGRMLAIVGRLPVMEAELLTRNSEAGFSTRELFETVLQPLPGAAHASHFSF